MSAEHSGLFEELTPPPGGAERFAQRLDELTAAPATAALRVQVLGTAACLALVVLLAAQWLRPAQTPPQLVAASPTVDLYGAPEFDRLLGRSRPAAELTVTVGSETATVTKRETANEKVRSYFIQ